MRLAAAGALAAVTLLALFGALALTGQAQTVTTLVSNIGQASGDDSSTTIKRAQGFTTGTNAAGYTLTGVDVVSGGSVGFTAQVCDTDASGNPTSTCTNLTAPGSFAAGTMSFNAPASTTLAPGKTYAVVLGSTGTRSVGTTASENEDAGQADGWSLANGLQFSNSPDVWVTSDKSLRIAIKGTAAVAPAITAVEVTSTPLLTSSGGSTPDTYGEGEDIEFTVTFNEAVEVTGDPQFGFSLAGPRVADYDSGSRSESLTFVHTVQSTDRDEDGIWVGNHASGNPTLQLDAADAITSLGGTDANLEHDTLNLLPGHKVDGSQTPGAKLSALVVNDGSSDLTLTPAFVSGTTSYTASVANEVAEVTVTPTQNDTTATIEYLDSSDMTLTDAGTEAGQQVTLTEGDNVIRVQVTTADGTNTLTYTVTVNRPADTTPTCTLNHLDIWCGVVTVGEISLSGSPYADGFVAAQVGDLSETNFTHETNSYTIDAILVEKPDSTSVKGGVLVSLTSALTTMDKTALVLYVGSTALPFVHSSYRKAGHWYTWEGDNNLEGLITPGPGLDWTSETTVTVRLREAPTCQPNPGDIWCGVVTAGDLSGKDGFFNNIGLLSDTTFSVGTNDYTIDQIYVNESQDGGLLQFSLESDLTDADKATLVLHIDGSSDTFASAIRLLMLTIATNGTKAD